MMTPAKFEVLTNPQLDAIAERGDNNRPAPIFATPYVWKDPSKLPRRDRLYGNLLIRKFVTATVAPGGIGKSTLGTGESLAQVSCKNLLGTLPARRLRVWLWNLEDPQEETERKIQAAAMHYRLTPDDIGDRLFVDSGRDQPLVIATTTKNGAAIARPVVDSLVAEIIERKIDIIKIDPFVSCHEVGENDNTAMDMIVKEWGKVAERGNCAVELYDHTRKMGGTETEVTVESSRGGKAKTDACRVVRVLNRMTKEEAERAGVDNYRLYFRTYNDKSNLAPPSDASDWFKLESVNLGNGLTPGTGDSVGVVVRWAWPDAFDGVTTQDLFAVQKAIAAGRWRQSASAKDWAGIEVGRVLGLDMAEGAAKTRVKSLLKTWIENKALKVVLKDDDSRHERPFVEVDQWANT
jgi:AAA domain